jgi:hypothetical protein
VLFSSPEVSAYINQNFEPIWVSVRPVPKITIDFGLGRQLTRTVNGNIATYVCASDGTVIDVLPGIYSSQRYLSALATLKAQFSDLTANPELMNSRIIAYHNAFTRIASTKRKPDSALSVISDSNADGTNERLKEALALDSDLNETERRPLIHEYLRDAMIHKNGGIKPDEMKHWLYREVLLADLDDPYLGIDRILTQTYPFKDQEQIDRVELK